MAGFGSDIAVDGDHIIASMTGISTLFQAPPAQTGSVFVFELKDGEWVERQKLAPDGLKVTDGFGYSIAASNQVLAISAPYTDNNCGAIYIYTKASSGRWVSADRLVIPGCNEEAFFGYALDVHGDKIAVGAPGYMGTGAAGVAQKVDGAWQVRPFNPIALEEGGRFGSSVTAGPKGFLVGAADTGTGSVHYFSGSDASAEHKQQIESPFGEKSSHFGLEMDWVGDRVIISAPGLDANSGNRGPNNPGAAIVMDLSDQNIWEPFKIIQPEDLSRPGFGSSVLLKGNQVWVGSPGADKNIGAVHTFKLDRTTEEYVAIGKLTVEKTSSRTGIGLKVAAGEDMAIVAAMKADFGEGKVYVFMQDEYSGAWKQVGDVGDEGRGLESITGDEVKCEEGSASEFDCSNVDILSFLPNREVGAKRGVIMNDVWGWTDPETGAEIAIVGRSDGTSFIDVSNANNPVYLGDLPATDTSVPNHWRDVKTYQNYAFVVADNVGKHGMQIFDLKKLRDLKVVPATFEADVVYDGIYSSHNVVINEDSGFAYLVGNSDGGETCGGSLHMVDIRNPLEPKFAGCYHDVTHPSAGRGVTHDAQCVNYTGPDTEHVGKEICFNSNERLLLVVDVSDKSKPVTLSAVDYPSVGYAHQGWLTDDQKYFYLDDEGDELQTEMEGTRTMIYDMEDLDDPVLVKEHFGTTKVSDHNLYVKGNYMYQSNYIGGLRILDIADPINPVEVGYFDTVPWSANDPGFAGSWSNYPFFKSGTIIVSSVTEGVFMLRQKKTAL